MARRPVRLPADNLVQGVSQQVETKRTLNHVEERLNITPSIVHGNTKRPSTTLISSLPTAVKKGSAVHFYTRDTSESYMVAASTDTIRVFDQSSGIMLPVNKPDGIDYLSCPNSPEEDLRFLTLGDFTFVCNTTKEVGLLPDKTQPAADEALLYVRQGDYGVTYSVFIGGSEVATLKTSADNADETSTEFIVQQLRQKMISFLSGTAIEDVEGYTSNVSGANGFTVHWTGDPALPKAEGYNDGTGEGGNFIRTGTSIEVTGAFVLTFGTERLEGEGTLYLVWDNPNASLQNLVSSPFTSSNHPFTARFNSSGFPSQAGDYSITGTGSVLRIKLVDGKPFDITATDSINNDAIRVVKGTAQRFEQLPPRAPDGYIAKITQSAGNADDDYFVRFEADDKTLPESSGVWVETIAPDVQYALDPATMPHVLVREADGTFTFKRGEWKNRKAGDDTTVPPASFVGRKINNLFFFQNRLGFLSGSNLITSQTSEYFDFWRRSARTKLDTDPVDISAISSEALTLRYALPFDEKLVVFADTAQLISKGGQTYTPATASLNVASNYEMDTRTAPVSVGRSIFFCVRQGAHTSVMEMQGADNDADKLFALEVTEHVPQYIPSASYRMVASAKANTLLLLGKGEEGAYVYNWLWAGRERVVSSWHKYALGASTGAWAGTFRENELLLVADHSSRAHLLKMVFDTNGSFSGGLDDTHLDFRVEADLSYKTLGGSVVETIATLPVVSIVPPTVLAERPDGSILDMTASHTRIGGVLTLPGEFTRVIVGEEFGAVLRFSKPYAVRFGPRGEMVADLTRRLQLQKVTLNLTDTGPFSVLIERPFREPRTELYTGRRVGAGSSSVGALPISSGAFSVSLKGKAEELGVTILADGWMPFCLTSAEWSGHLIRKL
jgi:hypothetical protein